MADGQDFDAESEDIPSEDRGSSEVFVRIAMVETAIEDRFPGQLLAPYKDWQQRRLDI